MALSKRDQRRLDAALRRLEAVCNPNDKLCGASEAAKKEVALYIDTWVVPLIRHVRMQYGRDRDEHDLARVCDTPRVPRTSHEDRP